MPPDGSVLVVEDQFLIADLLSMMLEDMGIPVCGRARSASEAILLAERHSPRLVLMDIRLKGAADGVDAAVAIHRAVGAKIIFISGSRDPETLERIARLHSAPVLFKLVKFDQLMKAIRGAMS